MANGPSAQKILLAILAGGLLAGAADIGVASVIYHSDPMSISRFISAGVLGKTQAVAMGDQASFIGMGCQEMISVLAATVYVLAGLRFPILFRRPVIGGIVFGLGVYLVMSFVVVPLSLAPKGKGITLNFTYALTLAANMVYGLIISNVAAWILKRGSRQGASAMATQPAE